MTEVEQLKERIRVLRKGIEAHARVANTVASADAFSDPELILRDVEDIADGLDELLRDDDMDASLAKVPA